MRRFACLIALMPFAGCGDGLPDSDMPTEPAKALRFGTDFKLHSLAPLVTLRISAMSSDEDKQDFLADQEPFHGWLQLGSTRINDDATRKKLLDALETGVSEPDLDAAKCFWPRHGISVQYEGKLHDFQICFECQQIYWTVDGDLQEIILVSGAPQPTFDQVLREASIRLPDDATRWNKEQAALALFTAKSLTLYSLDPTRAAENSNAEKFHDWPILGNREVDAPDSRRAVAEAMEEGIFLNDGVVADGLKPRHGIRVIDDGKQCDFVICFECRRVDWYKDGEKQESIPITNKPQTMLDDLLRNASNTLVDPAK